MKENWFISVVVRGSSCSTDLRLSLFKGSQVWWVPRKVNILFERSLKGAVWSANLGMNELMQVVILRKVWSSFLSSGGSSFFYGLDFVWAWLDTIWCVKHNEEIAFLCLDNTLLFTDLAASFRNKVPWFREGLSHVVWHSFRRTRNKTFRELNFPWTRLEVFHGPWNHRTRLSWGINYPWIQVRYGFQQPLPCPDEKIIPL